MPGANENERFFRRALESGAGPIGELPRRDSRNANGEGLLIATHLVRSNDDGGEWPEVRNGGVTGDLVVGEAHEHPAVSRADPKVTASARDLVRFARRGLSVAPAAGGAPQGDDLAEPAALPDGAGSAKDDLVVRADPRTTRVGRIRPTVEREVDARRHDCHQPTVTANYGGPSPIRLRRHGPGPSQYDRMVIETKELALAREHPRGTERRRLLPYRDALNDVAVYAALAESGRDAIVRWVETRRRIKEEFGIDHDPANLADPLLPAERLRAHVLAGERAAARRTDFVDPGGDLIAAVAELRKS